MSEILNIRADESGLNGREVNPYPKYSNILPAQIGEKGKDWKQFEFTVKTYPFTKQVEGGSVIRCKEIWQYKLKTETKWTSDLNMRHQGQTFEHWEYDLKMMSNDFETRQAYQPIEQPKEEKKRMNNENALLPISQKSELEKYKPIRRSDLIRDKDYSPVHDAVMTAIWDRIKEYGDKETVDKLWTSSMFPERLTKQILRIIEQVKIITHDQRTIS